MKVKSTSGMRLTPQKKPHLVQQNSHSTNTPVNGESGGGPPPVPANIRGTKGNRNRNSGRGYGNGNNKNSTGRGNGYGRRAS